MAEMVNVGMPSGPLVIADSCLQLGATSSYAYTSCLSTASNAGNVTGGAYGGGLLLPDEIGNASTNVKGRLNFHNERQGGTVIHSIITLVDHDNPLTAGTPGMRPLTNPLDTYIGTDTTGSGGVYTAGMSLAAPLSISSYINALPSGTPAATNWLEQLTASGKVFHTPLSSNNSVDFTGTTIFKARSAGGLTTSANGDIGYDATNFNWHGYQNGVDAYFWNSPVSGTYTDGDCVEFGHASTVLTLKDAGAPCGSGGGGGSPGGSTNAPNYNAGAGTFGGTNVPTTNGIYTMVQNVTANASVPPVMSLAGVPYNPQTGTSRIPMAPQTPGATGLLTVTLVPKRFCNWS